MIPHQHDPGHVRILVVDDHSVFAGALAARLAAEPDLEIVGVASSAGEGARLARRNSPDVVLLDIDLGDADGLELAPRLLDGHPERRIVVATAHATAEMAGRALDAGATGFVSKDGAFNHLVTVIRGVMCDETWVPPRLLTGVLRQMRRETERGGDLDALLRRLTPREREVLARMVGGVDRCGIAEDLGLSVDTVRTHTNNMFAKLQVHSVFEAVTIAVRAGTAREGGRWTSAGRRQLRSAGESAS